MDSPKGSEIIVSLIVVLLALAVWELFLRGFVVGLFTKKTATS